MASERLNTALAGTQNTQVQTQQKQNTIFDLVQSKKNDFAMALGKSLDPERFVRISLTTLRQNPKLQACSAVSLLGALMQSAQLGLEPNLLGQSYLIPFQNKGQLECQFQIGYKGLIKLFYNSPNAQLLDVHEVYSNDKFDYEFGLTPSLTHKPAISNRGEVIAYYAIAKLKEGATSFAVLSKEDALNHAKKFSQAYKGGYSPWSTNFDEMAKKTVIKMVLKYMPLSTERFIMQDETVKHFDNTVIDMTESPDLTQYEEIDMNTGEVKTSDQKPEK